MTRFISFISAVSIIGLLSACGNSAPDDQAIVDAIEDRFRLSSRTGSRAMHGGINPYLFNASNAQHGDFMDIRSCDIKIGSKDVDEIQGDDTFYRVQGTLTCSGLVQKNQFGNRGTESLKLEDAPFVVIVRQNTTGKIEIDGLLSRP
jgi:hypothetical protein